MCDNNEPLCFSKQLNTTDGSQPSFVNVWIELFLIEADADIMPNLSQNEYECL